MNKTPWRIRTCARAMVGIQVGHIRVTGLERVTDLAAGRPIVLAPTHMTDLDMAIAFSVLGRHLDIMIADKSSHHSFFENSKMNLLLRFAGPDFFFPIDYQEGRPAKGFFNPQNYALMPKAMERGRAVMIAAHRPMYVPQLPERGGIGAVYAAGIADAILVPVAVRLDTTEPLGYTNTLIRTMLKRPSARMAVGEPLRLGPLAPVTALTDEVKAELGRRSELLMAGIRDALGQLIDTR